jgi:membrane-associated HD superfamily phosphohydrolase
MVYPPDIDGDPPTFRFMVNKYLQTAPWLNAGIDLLMGIPGNKKASLRERMFLPVDMQEGLSDIVVNRGGKMIPLLRNPETVLESTLKSEKPKFFTSPVVVFSLLLILIIIASALIRGKRPNRVFDIIIFTIFSVFALLMIFFNFFTGHQQMKMNPNIIWLSPFIILCLISLLLNKNWHIWFRIVFILNIIWFIILLIFPGSSNNAFMPLSLILAVRNSVRSEFKWNPLSLEEEV